MYRLLSLDADYQHGVHVFSSFVYTQYSWIMHGQREHAYSQSRNLQL